MSVSCFLPCPPECLDGCLVTALRRFRALPHTLVDGTPVVPTLQVSLRIVRFHRAAGFPLLPVAIGEGDFTVRGEAHVAPVEGATLRTRNRCREHRGRFTVRRVGRFDGVPSVLLVNDNWLGWLPLSEVTIGGLFPVPGLDTPKGA